VTKDRVTVIGGGLAGCEAAFQLAARGAPVDLFEMRPAVPSPAHHTGQLAELVCSNSFKAEIGGRPSATVMLKSEMDALGSLILSCARATAVPAGTALAVDRERFSAAVTAALEPFPRLRIVRQEVTRIPEGAVIVATGPLTSSGFEPALSALTGEERLAFFDAAAPVVDGSTIDRSVCFGASRHGKGGSDDYLNCPLEREEYNRFIDALVAAERVVPREFESSDLFQACQPIEETARAGREAARFGAMKPVGLIDPATGRRPWAVVQLRPENRDGGAYNLVGFQTNLAFAEQRRIFRTIPGLARAEFLRYGVMHRNTFVDAPRLLGPDLSLRAHPRVRVAGQLSGTEGYLEAAATGLLAALSVHAAGIGAKLPVLPPETALGALVTYATDPATSPYQPMHVNFGILPPLDPPVRHRLERHEAIVRRGGDAMRRFLAERTDLGIDDVRSTLHAVAAP
jgi:methylenetetrahydrofolate--tRNA-(uracil-5-)-methyltransferase